MSSPARESQGKFRISSEQLLSAMPVALRTALMAECGQPLYGSGGLVRDCLLGRQPKDIDLTVPRQALPLAQGLARRLGAAYVPLSAEEGVARVVWGEVVVDIAQFREGTTTIEADLGRRDFTVNALAVALADGGGLIDPLGGAADVWRGRIRMTHPQAFAADPLRLLRAYRFQAEFGWTIEASTQAAIRAQVAAIAQVSGERVAAECERILTCPGSFPTMAAMAEDGLLFAIFPELRLGLGLLQPSSHHLDVFGHSMEALRQMEAIIARPEDFFPGWGAAIAAYLHPPRQVVRLKYAALLHDLGKTATYALKDGRHTFHNHDQAGLPMLAAIHRRLRWSNDDSRRIGQLVALHMWPFHLYNASLRTRVTPRAILKLGKAAGDELIGLFLLVMADSLAGQGPGKPAGMEEGIAALFGTVHDTYTQHLRPLLAAPLLTGRDLIDVLHLSPGPLFRRILDGLEEVRAANPALTREEALEWAAGYSQAEEAANPLFS